MPRLPSYTINTVAIGSIAEVKTGTVSHTVNAGSNLALLLVVGTHQGTISAVTWNGAAMTKIAEGASSQNECGEIWLLINPTPATGNFVVTGGGSWWGGAAVNLSNAKQTTTLTSATANGNSATASVAVTPPSSYNLIVAAVGSEATPTPATGLTTFKISQGASYENGGAAYVALTAIATQTMSFSLNSGQRWGIAAVAIEAAAVSATDNRVTAGSRTVAGARTISS